MARKQSLVYFAAISVALCVELLAIPLGAKNVQARSQTLLSQAFEAPNKQAPPTTGAGGVRGTRCISDKVPLTALMPAKAMPLTVTDSPTLFWYIPQSTAQEANFVLMDETKKEVIYQTLLTIPKQSGIVSLTLPASTALKIGKMYYWSFEILCDPEESTVNPIAQGWIERTELSQALMDKLKTAGDRARPAAYAAAGIWYEAIKSLADLRRQSPNDPTLVSDWEKLLQSVGLNAVVQQPLVDCCQAKN